MLSDDSADEHALPVNAWSTFTVVLNTISYASFVGGVVCLAFFALANIPQ